MHHRLMTKSSSLPPSERSDRQIDAYNDHRSCGKRPRGTVRVAVMLCAVSGGSAMCGDRHSRPALGEAVHVVVVVKAGTTVDAAALIAFCKQRIAEYKCPHTVDVRRPLANGGRCQDFQAGAASPLLGRSEPTCRLTRRFLLRSRVEFLRLPRVKRSHSRANPTRARCPAPAVGIPPWYRFATNGLLLCYIAGGGGRYTN